MQDQTGYRRTFGMDPTSQQATVRDIPYGDVNLGSGLFVTERAGLWYSSDANVLAYGIRRFKGILHPVDAGLHTFRTLFKSILELGIERVPVDWTVFNIPYETGEQTTQQTSQPILPREEQQTTIVTPEFNESLSNLERVIHKYNEAIRLGDSIAAEQALDQLGGLRLIPTQQPLEQQTSGQQIEGTGANYGSVKVIAYYGLDLETLVVDYNRAAHRQKNVDDLREHIQSSNKKDRMLVREFIQPTATRLRGLYNVREGTNTSGGIYSIINDFSQKIFATGSSMSYNQAARGALQEKIEKEIENVNRELEGINIYSMELYPSEPAPLPAPVMAPKLK